jgi:hypothetical protein
MKAEYRGGMIELAVDFNDKLEEMCNRLGQELSEAKVRLLYSNAMSLTGIDNVTDLNAIDAWHPSIQGHCRFADSAYPIVYQQAQFMGWGRTSKLSSLGN